MNFKLKMILKRGMKEKTILGWKEIIVIDRHVMAKEKMPRKDGYFYDYMYDCICDGEYYQLAWDDMVEEMHENYKVEILDK